MPWTSGNWIKRGTTSGPLVTSCWMSFSCLLLVLTLPIAHPLPILENPPSGSAAYVSDPLFKTEQVNGNVVVKLDGPYTTPEGERQR